ncbi:MAG: hypothetical protein NTW05_27700 [Pseudonocardiales bacterium]|jgi:hypothetical protein|nr:hypothetical protein [Pseudonocardiales bacterium]
MNSMLRTATRAGVRAGAAVAVAAVLAGGALAGCTTQGPTPTTPTAGATSAAPTTAAVPTGEGAVGEQEQAVAAALVAYQTAVAGGDYVLACSQMTTDAAVRLVGAVQAAGNPVPGCVEAMAAVLGQPGAAEAAIEAANSITVTDVTIEGLTATIRWSSTRQGVPRTDDLVLQQIDLQWRLAGPA